MSLVHMYVKSLRNCIHFTTNFEHDQTQRLLVLGTGIGKEFLKGMVEAHVVPQDSAVVVDADGLGEVDSVLPMLAHTSSGRNGHRRDGR